MKEEVILLLSELRSQIDDTICASIKKVPQMARK